MPRWIEGSTVRVAQLTGDYDPEYVTHFSKTSDWSADGIDLGANTEHGGRTFIFFGDAAWQAELLAGGVAFTHRPSLLDRP